MASYCKRETAKRKLNCIVESTIIKMSWPSVWQTNQTQGTAAQAPVAGMFQLTPEQQFAMQQQNWQQWQLYQAQLAQWQTQYGDQVKRA